MAVIIQKIDAIVRHQQPPATCALVRPRTKPCDIVVCSRSTLEVKQNKNMWTVSELHAIAKEIAASNNVRVQGHSKFKI